MFGMSAWLKTVITVILLATFIELLLPSSAMQRYARTVMSLFVLLTLLSPIVGLFQRSWQPQQLFALVESEQARMAAAEEAGGTMPSLEAIQRKADELKAASLQQEKKLVETELAAQIKSRLEGQTKLTVAAVTVHTGTDKQNKPYIQDVQVALASARPDSEPKEQGAEASGGKPDASSDIEIKPVDPVRIRIESDTDHHTSGAAVPASGSMQPPEYRQDEATIDRIMGEAYRLPSNRISTVYLGTAQAF